MKDGPHRMGNDRVRLGPQSVWLRSPSAHLDGFGGREGDNHGHLPPTPRGPTHTVTETLKGFSGQGLICQEGALLMGLPRMPGAFRLVGWDGCPGIRQMPPQPRDLKFLPGKSDNQGSQIP